MPRVAPQDVPPLVKLLCEDRRFKLEAYQFVRAGLSYGQEVLGLGGGPTDDDDDAEVRPIRHVTGQDLCLALKQLAHEQYGYMAKLVLNSWGVYSTSDFGEIVYNLIKIREMTKSEGDRREDFDNVYDFDQALLSEYVMERIEK